MNDLKQICLWFNDKKFQSNSDVNAFSSKYSRPPWNITDFLYTENIYHPKIQTSRVEEEKNIFNSFVGFPLLPSHSRTETSKFMTNTIWEISQVNSEQMTKVPSARLHSLALCCAMQFPNLVKDFIIQPKQTTVSLHLERWMHSNLNFFHWMCVFCREISSSIFLEWHDTFNNQCRSAQMKCVNFQWLFECFSFTRTRLENIFRILKWSKRDVCFGAVESACKLNICWKIVEILYQHFVMSLTHNATMRRPSELASLQIWQNMHVRYVIWSACL